MKVNDLVKLTGYKWDAHKLKGVIVLIEGVSKHDGSWFHSDSGAKLFVDLDPGDCWGGTVVSQASDFFFQKKVDMPTDPYWWKQHGQKILDDSHQEACSFVRTKMREWPYEKVVCHVFNQQEGVVKFFFADESLFT